MSFIWPVRVYYEDTDTAGVVYYANYLKFMERARTEWLRSLGFEQDRMMRDPGVVFAVRRVQVDYLKPARFNELVDVTAALGELGRASLAFAQEIRRAGDAGPEVISRGEITVACLDAGTLRPRRIPDSLYEAIERVR